MRRFADLVARVRRRKFVRDTLVLQAASVVQSGTYLVTSVLTARGLGRFENGRWATSRELYMLLFFLVSMGLTNAAVSRYSRARGAGDERGGVEALAALLKLGSGVTLAVLAMGFLAAPWAAERWYDDRQVGVITSILCCATVGEVLRSLVLAAFNGTRQMHRYAVFDATTNVLRVGLVATALAISRTPLAVAWAFLAHGVVSGSLALVFYVRASHLPPELAPPPLGQVLRAVRRAPLREFFGLSFLLALSKAMNTIIPRLGILFIPALATVADEGFDANGAYQVGSVLTLVLTGVIGAVATNVLPTLGHKMGRSDVSIDELGGTLRRLSLTSGALAVGATVLSVPVMWFVVKFFYGDAYMPDAFHFYLLLATGNLFIGFAVIVEPFYIYARRMHHHVAQSLVYATLATVGIYSAAATLGPKGAAAAGGLCRIFALCHLVYIYVYFRRARSSPRETETPDAHREGAPP